TTTPVTEITTPVIVAMAGSEPGEVSLSGGDLRLTRLVGQAAMWSAFEGLLNGSAFTYSEQPSLQRAPATGQPPPHAGDVPLESSGAPFGGGQSSALLFSLLAALLASFLLASPAGSRWLRIPSERVRIVEFRSLVERPG
ncbi:MAG: hypothetical protein M3346_03065, partial [Actinomycetota bacterium]|nr:hypothetical protein [Actinomycetota bacterium]